MKIIKLTERHVVCDRCGAIEKHWNDMPKGWEMVEDRDLCPKCLKLYNRSWKNKIKKVEDKYQDEINQTCKDRDKAIDIMFKTFLNTQRKTINRER